MKPDVAIDRLTKASERMNEVYASAFDKIGIDIFQNVMAGFMSHTRTGRLVNSLIMDVKRAPASLLVKFRARHAHLIEDGFTGAGRGRNVSFTGIHKFKEQKDKYDSLAVQIIINETDKLFRELE